MRKVTEFYPERQGRPFAPETTDLETGQTLLFHSYLALKEEYVKVEKLFERLLNELVQKMVEQTIELKQVKLHLASMSEEDISEEDVEIE